MEIVGFARVTRDLITLLIIIQLYLLLSIVKDDIIYNPFYYHIPIQNYITEEFLSYFMYYGENGNICLKIIRLLFK